MMTISHNPIKYYGSLFIFSKYFRKQNKYGGPNMGSVMYNIRWSQHHIISKLDPWAASSARKASRVYILRSGEAVKDS